LNSYNVGLSLLNKEYRNLLLRSGINVIDGLILLRTIRFFSTDGPKNQIRGVDFLRNCLTAKVQDEPLLKRPFFLGSTNSVLNLIVEKCYEMNPKAICQTLSPPFANLEDMDLAGIAKEIKRHQPDVIWVGLGTPKQDFVAKYLAEEIGVPAVAIGAAFEFLVGTRKESSERMRENGLEWLTRLIDEPKRLWSRYLIVSPLSFVYPLFVSIRFKKSK
jgi:N-acetylglucosaminyldiphosphoundecaprenol N-acetyl-beta-D-mannosaminyltransferase